jgi:hypothetical protein
MKTYRPIFCPIGVNLCQGAVVTVTLDFDRCSQCGVKMSKHPTGVCQRCFVEKE